MAPNVRIYTNDDATFRTVERDTDDGVEVLVVGSQGERVPNIPPNASNWSMTGILTFTEDVTLHSLWPHMHYRGKDMRFELTHPDGKKETLLNVPNYNPHWQLTYINIS